MLNVKKKIGCLSYAEDSKGFKSIHSQNAMKDAVKGGGGGGAGDDCQVRTAWLGLLPAADWRLAQAATVSHFASDAIVSHFCSLVLAPKAATPRESEIQQMVCAFLVDCASSETIECLHCLMELERRAKQQSPEGHSSSLSLWQVKLAVSGAQFCRSAKAFFVQGLRNFIDSKVTGACVCVRACLRVRPASALGFWRRACCLATQDY